MLSPTSPLAVRALVITGMSAHGVTVGVGVGLGEGDGVPVGVGVGVKVAVAVGVGVGVNVAVAVGVGVGAPIVITSVALVVVHGWPLLTVMVTLVTPAVVGVPERTFRLLPFPSDKPGGSGVAV